MNKVPEKQQHKGMQPKQTKYTHAILNPLLVFLPEKWAYKNIPQDQKYILRGAAENTQCYAADGSSYPCYCFSFNTPSCWKLSCALLMVSAPFLPFGYQVIKLSSLRGLMAFLQLQCAKCPFLSVCFLVLCSKLHECSGKHESLLTSMTTTIRQVSNIRFGNQIIRSTDTVKADCLNLCWFEQ